MNKLMNNLSMSDLWIKVMAVLFALYLMFSIIVVMLWYLECIAPMTREERRSVFRSSIKTVFK